MKQMSTCKWTSCKKAAAIVSVAAAIHTFSAGVQAFDFQTGSAPVEIIIPKAIPAIYASVSPNANDASLVLYVTTLITTSWFDAIAPYHPSAVGVYSNLGRRPGEESTDNANMNVALCYASYRVLNWLLPQHAQDWRDMLLSVGLDPDNAQEDTATPAGLGNLAGKAVIAARENDGMNRLGHEGGRTYNRQPYADYLGYKPVNTAHQLNDPSRWQPDIIQMGNGLFRVQKFATPQLRVTLPYSYGTPEIFETSPPIKSHGKGHFGKLAYKEQADEVLAASAALTDYQKMAAELFDDKLLGLGFSGLFASVANNLTLSEFVQYDFLVNIAAFDAAIAVWKEKYRHDAVRPFSAIRHLYKDQLVTAWGGPGIGTVADLPGGEWRSYLQTADHPEYPSGSAALCAAHAQASRRFLGSDVLGWAVAIPSGSSRIEPGITPSQDIVLGPWATWTEFENECGLSRLWGGVHFKSAIKAGQELGRPIGDLAYEFLLGRLEGNAP
jgi:hypothetical protein